jgi:hypothetical protein
MSRVKNSEKAPVADYALQRVFLGTCCRGAGRFRRLLGNERRCHADEHEHCHERVACAPRSVMTKSEALKAADNKQRARGRDQHADAVGGDIGCHAGRLFAFVQAFDAEGVDYDILRRRGGGNQKRSDRHQQG